MKAIKPIIKNGMCETVCETPPGLPNAGVTPRVASFYCQNKCPHFDAYDEGKGIVVLCSHPEQKLGAYVHE